MARPERFELPTSWFVARHSIQLSYGRAGCAKSPKMMLHFLLDMPIVLSTGGERGIRTLDGAINPILP